MKIPPEKIIVKYCLRHKFKTLIIDAEAISSNSFTANNVEHLRYYKWQEDVKRRLTAKDGNDDFDGYYLNREKVCSFFLFNEERFWNKIYEIVEKEGFGTYVINLEDE